MFNTRKSKGYPFRNPGVMHFINCVFSSYQREQILEWSAKAADNKKIRPLKIRTVTGFDEIFYVDMFDQDHLLWCKQYVERKRNKEIKKQNKLREYSINKIIPEHLLEVRKNQTKKTLVKAMLLNLSKEIPYNSGICKYCDENFLKKVLHLVIQHYPNCDIAEFIQRQDLPINIKKILQYQRRQNENKRI